MLALAGLAAIYGYGRWHQRRNRAEVDARDELGPWRGQRVIRGFRLVADSREGATLLVELAHEAQPDVTLTTLRFAGVAALHVAQLGSLPLSFDGLRSERLDGRRFGPLALRVFDSWDDMLQFYCTSFEELPRGATARAV